MVSLIVMPMSSLFPLFAIPTWLAWSLTLAGVGLSAVLSGWLPRRPKLQRLVTALAFAWVFAAGLFHALAPTGSRFAIFVSDQCWVFCWMDWF